MLSSEPVRFEIPHEKGEWMNLRRLSWKQIRQARKLQQEEQREIAKSFGAEFMAALTSGNVDEDKARRIIKEQQYALPSFDLECLLASGIAAWSYKDKDGKPVPINPDSLESLDEKTAVWAAQSMLDLVKPPTEDQEKND